MRYGFTPSGNAMNGYIPTRWKIATSGPAEVPDSSRFKAVTERQWCVRKFWGESTSLISIAANTLAEQSDRTLTRSHLLFYSMALKFIATLLAFQRPNGGMAPLLWTAPINSS